MARHPGASESAGQQGIARKAGTTMAQTLRTRSPRAHTDDDPRELVLVDAVDANREPGADEIRVVIAYGDVLARAGLHALLQAEPDIAVVGSAADAKEALALVRRSRPDVVLMDVTPPGVNGVEVARQILAEPDPSGVSLLILSVSEQD